MQDDDRSGEGPLDRGATGSGRAPGRTGAGAVGRAAVALAVCAYAWWAVGLGAFSLEATVAVVLAGVVAMTVGARRRCAAGSPADARDAAAWAVLTAAAGALQLAAYLQSPRDNHPTLSSLSNALLDSHAARAAAFVAWLAATVELARR